MLEGKIIVLGVTGSIAAFKAAELASRLAQAGAQVDVVLTKAAQEFITPLTFRSLTHRPVITDLFDPNSELSLEHVALAQRAEAILIAPATANFIAKLSHGLADDALSCTVLASRSPVIIAPAMDVQMYENPITQDNLAMLRARGFTIVGPGYGRLASGLMGMGRLAEMEEILGTLRLVMGRTGDLAGRRIVVSAGGTQEPIDPVRHITNRSSGKMGYALAEAARDRGAEVVLVSAPTHLPAPVGAKLVPVRTAQEMQSAVMEALRDADALIMAAAVTDYRLGAAASQKIKRSGGGLTLELVENPDILAEAASLRPSPGRRPILVGFAAESEELIANARAKLERKGIDLMVANDITAADAGFGADDNRVVLLEASGEATPLPLMSKHEVAHRVLDRVAALLAQTP